MWSDDFRCWFAALNPTAGVEVMILDCRDQMQVVSLPDRLTRAAGAAAWLAGWA